MVQAAGLDVSDPAFKRHDTLGWNYRVPEFCAAIALVQLEKITELVEIRIKAAQQYDAILEETKCSFLRKQHVPNGWIHSYRCWLVLFLPDKANGDLIGSKTVTSTTTRSVWGKILNMCCKKRTFITLLFLCAVVKCKTPVRCGRFGSEKFTKEILRKNFIQGANKYLLDQLQQIR